MHAVVYRWLSSDGFLINSLLPSGTAFEADVHDTVDRVLERVPAETKLFVFHLNCTLTSRFPLCRRELVETIRARNIRVLNAEATDISKKHVQSLCADLGLNSARATAEGEADETVIVKSNLNFGGDSEWALVETDRKALGIPTGSDMIWTPHDYRILPRKKVPGEWWRDERLAIERMVTNRDNRWYRAFLCLDRVAVCEFWSPVDIKKVAGSTLLNLWTLSPHDTPGRPDAPEGLTTAVTRFARACGLDVGAIDVVVDDEGLLYIIDANTTPAYNHPVPGVVEHLRHALA